MIVGKLVLIHLNMLKSIKNLQEHLSLSQEILIKSSQVGEIN
jgi:hypothetical protein